MVLALSAPGHSTLAQQPAAGPTQFDIPAQPLETALGAFGAASRLQVLYETSMTEGRRSTEVRSLPSHETALRRLLADTGLDFTYTEERAFTLIYARQFLTRPISDFYPYLGDVQSRIVALLCRYDETRPGAFRIAMQFRIKPDGRIETPVLLASTGTSRRDAAITDLLTNLSVNAVPPADMPQPVTMVLHSGAPNGTETAASRKRERQRCGRPCRSPRPDNRHTSPIVIAAQRLAFGPVDFGFRFSTTAAQLVDLNHA